MDDDSRRRRRQNEQSPYSASDPRYGQTQVQGRGFSGGSSDRFRAPPPLTSSPTASRAIAGPSSGYTYYTESPSTFPAALPANTMQYQAEYAQDQRQQQSFASYSSSMMYGVTQQTPQNAAFDQTSQFQPRQPAAMQMLSDVASPYYASEPTNTTGPSVLQHQSSSSSTAVYQQIPAERNQLLQGYAGNMAGMGNIAPATEVIEDSQTYEAGGLDEAYTTYQHALKEIFLNIRNHMLVEASASLVEVSDWLLSHVGDLGLTADDENLHSDRINLWNQFNTAWLAVLQRQKDLTENILQSGIPPRHPYSLISPQFLDRMAKELIRLCDNIEKHGLVDYQYGVWEERIISILSECADLSFDYEGAGESSESNRDTGLGRAPT